MQALARGELHLREVPHMSERSFLEKLGVPHSREHLSSSPTWAKILMEGADSHYVAFCHRKLADLLEPEQSLAVLPRQDSIKALGHAQIDFTKIERDVRRCIAKTCGTLIPADAVEVIITQDFRKKVVVGVPFSAGNEIGYLEIPIARPSDRDALRFMVTVHKDYADIASRYNLRAAILNHLDCPHEAIFKPGSELLDQPRLVRDIEID
jgi:hypothetical protein